MYIPLITDFALDGIHEAYMSLTLPNAHSRYVVLVSCTLVGMLPSMQNGNGTSHNGHNSSCLWASTAMPAANAIYNKTTSSFNPVLAMIIPQNPLHMCEVLLLVP